MDKIVLSEKQKNVLQKQLNGEYSPFFASEEDQIALNGVIDMANSLLEELNAYDEWEKDFEMDMMAWFWDKYQKQDAE